ncbi:MAG: sensor domain-containing diguanylate cyclase, partial [Thermoanaerobaculia bacterium]
VARALRVPFDGTTLELEAAAIFPAVVLAQSWQSGVVLAVVSVLATRAVARRGRLNWRDADDATDLVFAYGASCFFFVSLVGGVAGRLAGVLLFGATLLVFFFARVILGAVHAAAQAHARVATLLRAAALQFFALILLSPVMALVVLLHPGYGILGTILAFTSVALVSASLRNLAQARSRTAVLARQNRELATLREVSSIFAGTASDEEVLERLYRVLYETLSVRAIALVSYEDEPDGKGTVALRGETTIDRRSFLDWLTAQHDMDSSFVARAPDPRVFSGIQREVVLNVRLAHQVQLPLQTPELIAGLMVLESEDPVLLEAGTLRELTVVADHVALSLQDRNLRRQMQEVNERLQSRAETLHRILEVSNELKAHLTLEHVLTNIVRAVSTSLGLDVVLLSLYDRNENAFERRAHIGMDASWGELDRQKVPREEIARWFSERFRISKSYFINHLDRFEPDDSRGRLDRRRRTSRGGTWHPQDMLFIPLTSGDQLVGVLQVDHPKNGGVPKLEDVQALEIFANQAVTAIQSARAYETTRQMSVRDSLTEAFNHRHFQETLYREITRHERSGQPLALVMVDIDDFKKINDRWGHPVGDLVLRGLVEEVLKGVREMDTVARYGGEEFALILPETPLDKAQVVADRLRARVEGRLFVTPDISHPLTVTISLGLACFPEDANSKRALVERADQALYQAKRSGKNCVVTASSLQDLQVL